MTYDLRVAATFLRVAASGYSKPTSEQLAEWQASLVRAEVGPELAGHMVRNVEHEADHLADLADLVARSVGRLTEDIRTITERTGHGRAGRK